VSVLARLRRRPRRSRLERDAYVMQYVEDQLPWEPEELIAIREKVELSRVRGQALRILCGEQAAVLDWDLIENARRLH